MSTPPSPATAVRRAVPRLRLLLVVVLVVHCAALYWPRIDVQGPVPGTYKVVHVLLFLTPTVVALLARVRPALVGAVAVHAPVSELVQHYLLPHRTGDVADAVADLCGVVLGVVLVVVGRAVRRW